MLVALKWQRALSYALIITLGVGTALYLGKDFGWDSLSYHLYAGFSALNNRFGIDYFASSSQSYLNPYAHVPFYLMVKQDLAPQLIVAGLALIHVLNLLLVYEIALLLNRRQNGQVAWLAVGLAVLLALCNPIFLLELGNTFSEISTCVPVLAGWYLLIREFDAPRRSRLLLAGTLIGIGVALKLTNLFFTVTVLPLLLLAPTSWKARGQAVLLVAAGGVLGLLLAGGWWGWQLWQEFGNPLFPMFNQFFQSPEYHTSASTHYRFLPDSGLALLLKPFAMAVPDHGIHIETVAPDIRYAALFLLLCLFGLKYALGASPLATRMRIGPFAAFQRNRALSALTASLVLTWVFWGLASGNGRYFFPMSCLASVVLASLFFRFTSQWRFLVYGGVTLVLVQAGMTLVTSATRWNPVLYGEHWFEVDVPPQLQQQPSLYLHISGQPASFLLNYLAPGSAMINPTGMFVVEENAKMRALLDKHRGHVRVMRRYVGAADGPPAEEYDFFLTRFGLSADMSTCLPIRFKLRHAQYPDGVFIRYLSCGVKPRQWPAAQREAYLASKKRNGVLFDRLEAVCPHVFQPRGLLSEGDGKQFWRNYANTDTVLQQHVSGMITYHNMLTNNLKVNVGTIAELERAMPPREKICP